MALLVKRTLKGKDEVVIFEEGMVVQIAGISFRISRADSKKLNLRLYPNQNAKLTYEKDLDKDDMEKLRKHLTRNKQ